MEQAGVGAVADLVKPTVEAIGKGIAESLTRQFNYLCCFKDNIKTLEEESESLEDQRAELKGIVDVTESNAQEILPGVKTWFRKTDQLQVEKGKIAAEIPNSQSPCLNIISRYSLSKKAKETAEAIEKLRNTKFDSIAQPPPSASKTPFQLKETLALQSRKDIEDAIVTVLASPGPHKVGIGGMGGVGKTTIAEKIMRRMLTEKLVDEAIKLVVAQQPDVMKIQLQMAEQLGFTELERWKTSQERARQLSIRLTDKRILIVLDDIWTILNLEELGLHCEGASAGFSILLTSRDRKVLSEMNAQLFAMEILDESEAWSLFKDKAGACVDDSNLVSIAEKVAKECKGLPVAIITVGSALKDEKKKPIWKKALRQLTSSNPKEGSRVWNEVYKPLRLSYDFLQDEDAKSLFLLCCLFPDDFEISLDALSLYSMGLKMFKGVNRLEEVRETVFCVVMELKSRFLLLDGGDENKVTMHDVIRDVAIFIAKEKKLLGEKHGSEGKFDRNCEWISVFTSSTAESFDHLAESNFPTLRLLAIHKISLFRHEDRELKIGDISLLEGMRGLNVLSLRKSSFKSLGKTVELPKNLRTLRLENCHLKTLSFAGALLNLEILSCYECREIKELPLEIGNLKHLKLLDLSGCLGIERIAAGVIAKLVELEELKMLRSFEGWESSKIKEEDRRNVALNELESLQKLRCLEIQIEDHQLAEEEVHLSANIVKYAIFIGPRRRKFGEYSPVESEKVLSMRGFPKDTNFAEWIKKLVSSTDEELHLAGEGSTNLDISQVYNKIKRLEIERCEISSVMDLVRSPTQNANASFGGLGRIWIEKCHKLRNLSWLGRGNDGILLPQLERLEIEDCEMMEEIVVLENEENNNGSGSIIIFSKLVELRLNNMPKLTAVVRGAAETIQFPLLETLRINDCPKLKSIEYPMENDGRRIHNYDGSLHLFCSKRVNFGGLKILEVGGYNEEVVGNNIWCSQISSCFFQTLETLRIWRCDKLSSLFAHSIVKNLVNLNRLWISNCKMMEQVVVGVEKGREEFCGEQNGDGDGPIQQQQCYYSNTNKDDCGEMDGVIVIFPKLKYLELRNLPRLRGVGKGIQGMEFPMLHDLYIHKCPKLRNSIWLTRSECVDNHNHHHDDDEALHLFCHHKVKFDALEWMEIDGVGNVSSLWCPEIPQHFFRALESVNIEDCQNIKNLFSSSIVENLVNLNVLVIENCEKMEEVIKIDKARDEISKEKYGRIEEEENGDGAAGNTRHITFPTLRTLRLMQLSNLTCLGKGMESIEFPMLKELKIQDCQELIGMVGGSWKSKINNNEEKEQEQKQKIDENSHLLCNHKVKFSVLESIYLSNCNNLRSLFSCTTVENLINFKRLSISQCKQMEKVITGDKEIYRSSMLFPSLESIKFEGLHSLKMLCAWIGALEWPFLERISIKRCPKMEFLTPGSIRTPKLYEILVDNKVFEEEEWNEMKDLNRFICHHIVSAREESTEPVVEHGETSTNKMMEIEEIDEDEHT